MSVKTEPKDLETVLTKLREECQTLADLLTRQGESQDRVLEVEKVLLRDASGQCRGNLSANPDGSTDLLLSDQAGHAWVRLGVNRNGEAFLELKDQKGESSFKVAVGAPGLDAAPGPAATPAEDRNEIDSQPGMPAEDKGAPGDDSGLAPALSGPGPNESPDRDADGGIWERLEQLGRQYRRLKWFTALILVVLGASLAAQAHMLFRPHSPGAAGEALVVRDPGGNIRAWLGKNGDQVGLDLRDAQGRRRATLGLGADGTPGVAFYDQEQRLRAELNLGADGEPKLTLRDERGAQIQKAPKSPEDAAQSRPPVEAGLGPEAGDLPGPPAAPAAPAETVAPDRKTEAEVEVVGSKTSNKYHYPVCRWVKAISPGNLIKFKSTQEAQEQHYIPCPVCKPPPLSKEPPATP